jgi:hypothetical protein
MRCVCVCVEIHWLLMSQGRILKFLLLPPIPIKWYLDYHHSVLLKRSCSRSEALCYHNSTFTEHLMCTQNHNSKTYSGFLLACNKTFTPGASNAYLNQNNVQSIGLILFRLAGIILRNLYTESLSQTSQCLER